MVGIGAANRASAHSGLAQFSNLTPHNQNTHIPSGGSRSRRCLYACGCRIPDNAM